MTYLSPRADMPFALREVAGLEEVISLPGYENATADTIDASLAEAAIPAGTGIAPLNRDGDGVVACLEYSVVRSAPGFADAYKQFVAAGTEPCK